MYEIQAGEPAAAEALGELAATARERGWDEVERACLFGEAVRAWISREDTVGAAVDALVQRAEWDLDPVMLAAGLALGSDGGFGAPSAPNTARDDGLARAIVLLERPGGGTHERITAHTACAIALGNRWLFELGESQLAAALAAGAGASPGSLDFLLAPITFNLAEWQVCWASLLFQLGDSDGVRGRRRAGRSAAAATQRYEMPEAWRRELAALELVLDALAGVDVALQVVGERRRLGADESGRVAALLVLAEAVAAVTNKRPDRALLAARAVAALDPASQPHFSDLALFLVATIESSEGHDAGLRYGMRQLEQHWAKRSAALGAFASRVESERRSVEHEALSRHARLDDLTGIGNRRAIERFTAELIERGVESVALILIDVDAFKEVNDRHGHLAGDEVLIDIARLLERHVAAGDLAARIGGDEFAVMLAGAGLEAATERASEILLDFDATPCPAAAGVAIRLSAGTAAGHPAELIRIRADADVALYRAKSVGGHRVGRAATPLEAATVPAADQLVKNPAGSPT